MYQTSSLGMLSEFYFQLLLLFLIDFIRGFVSNVIYGIWA